MVHDQLLSLCGLSLALSHLGLPRNFYCFDSHLLLEMNGTPLAALSAA
jgi:hypothetical protein